MKKLIVVFVLLVLGVQGCGAEEQGGELTETTSTLSPAAATETVPSVIDPTATLTSTSPAVSTETATAVPTPTATAPAPTATATATAAPTEAPLPTPRPRVEHEFSGSGAKVLGPIEIFEGVLVLSATHEGSANFIVQVVGADYTEYSFNKIGNFSGAVAHGVSSEASFGLEPGEVRIQVQADGPWELTVSQEFPNEGTGLPVHLDGTGPDVRTWLLLRDGQYVLKGTHTGSANFIVKLIKADGSHTEYTINAIGDYSGEQLINVQDSFFGPTPGLYAVVVEADGDWTIDIE